MHGFVVLYKALIIHAGAWEGQTEWYGWFVKMTQSYIGSAWGGGRVEAPRLRNIMRGALASHTLPVSTQVTSRTQAPRPRT